MANGDDHDKLTILTVKMDHVVSAVDRIETQIGAQWKRIDTHSHQIARWKGALGILATLWGFVTAWVTGLFGGDR